MGALNELNANHGKVSNESKTNPKHNPAGPSQTLSSNASSPLNVSNALKKSSMALGMGGLTPKGVDSAFKKSALLLTTSIPTSTPTNLMDSNGAKKSALVLTSAVPMNAVVPKNMANNAPAILSNNVAIQSNVKPPVGERPIIWTKSSTKSAAVQSLQPKDPTTAEKINARRTSLSQSNERKRRESLQQQLEMKQEHHGMSKENSMRFIERQESMKNTSKSTLKKDESTKALLKQEPSIFSKSSEKLLDSKMSLLLDDLVKNLDDLEKPLRGPVLLQLFLLYLMFILILLVSWRTNWAPNIRFYTTFIYFVACIICFQIGRIAYAKSIDSMIPIYIALIPFIGVILISREAYQTVFVLWFVSSTLTLLQSGHPLLRMHLIIYSILLMVIYAILVYFMSIYYIGHCSSFFCGIPLETTISAAHEAVLLADCLVILLGFLVLESFIKLNALTLVERQTFMSQLVKANVELKKQIKGDETVEEEDEVELEAPLTRAIQILSKIKEDESLDRMVKDEVDFIMDVLSQDPDKLFTPDIYQKPADAEVHDWLNDLMLQEKHPIETQLSTMALELSISDPFASPQLDQILLPNEMKIFEYLTIRFEDPEFDIFELSNMTNGRSLYYIGWFVFKKCKLDEQFGMNEEKFKKWISIIESGYHASNPYHNLLHAADVTHSMLYYVSRPRIWSILKTEEKLAAIIAPIIHDYSHPGYNNSFLISTANSLALRYNDLAVLEHFHAASVFTLMMQQEHDILSSFTNDSRKIIREMIISMVLATDMAVHFEWIGKFKNKIAGQGFIYENKLDRKLILNLAMKCADINNPSKKLKYCRKWTEMIMEEFFRQGDEERRRGLKVSMFMDRQTTDIPKCQLGFIDFIVQPLYEAWHGFMQEDVAKHLENISKNKEFWKKCTENPSLYHEHDNEQVFIDTLPVVAPMQRHSFLANASGNRPIDAIMSQHQVKDMEKNEPSMQNDQSLVIDIKIQQHVDVIDDQRSGQPNAGEQPNVQSVEQSGEQSVEQPMKQPVQQPNESRSKSQDQLIASNAASIHDDLNHHMEMESMHPKE